MFRLLQLHFKQFFFYVGLLMSIFFLAHNLLLIKHYQLDRQINRLEKEFQEISLQEKKLRSLKEKEIDRIFRASRSQLKKYSVRNIPLVNFE